MRKVITIVATLLAVTLGTIAPASAQTVKRFDTYNRDAPAFNLKHATFRYYGTASARTKVENLSKRRTVVVFKFISSDFDITVTSQHRNGNRVTRAVYRDDHSGSSRIRRGVSADWNFGRDVVTFRVGSGWLDTFPRGSRANFLTWTQVKGAFHGNYEGDYVHARVRRG